MSATNKDNLFYLFYCFSLNVSLCSTWFSQNWITTYGSSKLNQLLQHSQKSLKNGSKTFVSYLKAKTSEENHEDCPSKHRHRW